MIQIPYARESAYNRDAYVTRMADLMMRQGNVAVDAARQRGERGAQRWAQVGNVAMSTMAQYAQDKDAERKLALQQQQQEIENARADRAYGLQRDEVTERGKEREADRQWRNDQERERRADRGVDRMAVGERVLKSVYDRDYSGTSAAQSLEYQPANDQWLDFSPYADREAEGLEPMTPARPEGYERMPSQAERVQMETLERQKESTAATVANLKNDNELARERLRADGVYRNSRLAFEARRTAATEQRARAAVNSANAATAPTEITAPLAGDSQDLMGQAGLSYNAFLALTGKMAQLPRDRATRERATQEVQSWARNKGIDVSTLTSQYKAVNETLEFNIKRRNAVLGVQDELVGDIANLKTAASAAGLNDVRAVNAAKLALDGQLNDPNAADYAFALNALVNDLALYNAASTGRTADQSDINEAKQVVMRGMASGSLTGLETSLTRSVANMSSVLENSVNRSRKDVWNIFGVGDKYKDKGKSAAPVAKPDPFWDKK